MLSIYKTFNRKKNFLPSISRKQFEDQSKIFVFCPMNKSLTFSVSVGFQFQRKILPSFVWIQDKFYVPDSLSKELFLLRVSQVLNDVRQEFSQDNQPSIVSWNSNFAENLFYLLPEVKYFSRILQRSILRRVDFN